MLRVILDKVKHPADLLFGKVAAKRSHNVFQGFFTRMFPEDEPAFASYQFRGEVFIRCGVFKNCRDMDTTLVGKRKFTGDGFVPRKGNSREFFDRVGELCEMREIVSLNSPFHPQCNKHLLQ